MGPSLHPDVKILYNFITEQEEEYIMNKVDDIGGVALEGIKRAGGWQELNGRRSMPWGGVVTGNHTLLPIAFPAFMSSSFPRVLERIRKTGAFDAFGGEGADKGPNHCLVNEYKPGDGIMPHTDGPAYAPLVATLSLGSHTILSFRPSPTDSTSTNLVSTSTPSEPSPDPTCDYISLLLPPRSLLLLSGELYGYMHGIETYEFDKMETLKACLNWEQYWDETDGVVDFSSDEDSDEEEKDEEEKEAKRVGQETEARMKRESIARRRFVEDGDGWERGRRISLTCRRVLKVRKGIKLG